VLLQPGGLICVLGEEGADLGLTGATPAEQALLQQLQVGALAAAAAVAATAAASADYATNAVPIHGVSSTLSHKAVHCHCALTNRPCHDMCCLLVAGVAAALRSPRHTITATQQHYPCSCFS
jgi:hypothetical protein